MNVLTPAKLAVAGLAAGLTLLAVGSVVATSPQPDATFIAPVAEAETGPQPDYGLAPLDAVVALWRERTDGQPTDYLSRTQLGLALSARAREEADLTGYEDAESVLREAVELNPRYDPARLALASAVHSQHRFDEAAAIADEILDDDPSSIQALTTRADARFELGDYEAAAVGYHTVAQAERSAAAVSRLARLASVQGDNGDAIELAAEALDRSGRLALRPSSAAFYWMQLGHFRFEAGDADGAIDDLTQALAIAPDHPGSSEKLAFVLAAVGNDRGAAELYERLLSIGPAADLHGSYADVLRRLGQEGAAAEHDRIGLRLARDTQDRFAAERRHLADFYLTRDPSMAVELAEADLAERQDVGAYHTLAWALHQDGRNVDAVELIDRALEVGTRRASLLYHAAEILAADGQRERARVLVVDALAINPTFHPSEADSARALLEHLTT